MVKKKKQLVWHKRRSTFVPASCLKARGEDPPSPAAQPPAPGDTGGGAADRQKFFRCLADQIKRAARVKE